VSVARSRRLCCRELLSSTLWLHHNPLAPQFTLHNVNPHPTLTPCTSNPRGPGLKEGAVSKDLGSHVDLATTFVTLAGGRPPALSDGQPAPLQPVAKPGASFFVPKIAYEL